MRRGAYLPVLVALEMRMGRLFEEKAPKVIYNAFPESQMRWERMCSDFALNAQDWCFENRRVECEESVELGVEELEVM